MYLGYQNDKIKFYTEEMLNPNFYQLDRQEYTEDEYVLSDDGSEYILKDKNWEAGQAQKEHERIQSLSMTRSDFFDGTIKAFGADSEDLLKAIEYVLGNLEIADVDKKVALNNYKNALNFYRKHPLFTMLSDVGIPVSENINITISSEQWDRFFDETDKKNPEAYKELLPVAEETEEPVEGVNEVSNPDGETTPPIEKEAEVTSPSNIEDEVEDEDTIITNELSI